MIEKTAAPQQRGAAIHNFLALFLVPYRPAVFEPQLSRDRRGRVIRQRPDREASYTGLFTGLARVVAIFIGLFLGLLVLVVDIAAHSSGSGAYGGP